MTAKEYLNQYLKLNREIDSLWADIQRLRSLATQTSSGNNDGMPKAPRCNGEAPFVSVVDKLMNEEDKMNRKIDKLTSLRDNINKTIDAVQDRTLRALLRYRYICGMTFEDIAKEMNYSSFHVRRRLHTNALKKVQEALESTP